MVSMLYLLVTNRTLGDNANAVMVFWGYFCDYCCRIELNVFSLAMSSLARLIVPTLLWRSLQTQSTHAWLGVLANIYGFGFGKNLIYIDIYAPKTSHGIWLPFCMHYYFSRQCQLQRITLRKNIISNWINDTIRFSPVLLSPYNFRPFAFSPCVLIHHVY